MVIVTGIPLALLVVIVAFAIMFVAAPQLTRSIWRLSAPKRNTHIGAIMPGPADSPCTQAEQANLRLESREGNGADIARHSDTNETQGYKAKHR